MRKFLFLSPAGNDGSDTGASTPEDRGDDFIPTGADADGADDGDAEAAAEKALLARRPKLSLKASAEEKDGEKAAQKTPLAEAGDEVEEEEEEGEEKKPEAKKKPGGMPWSRHKDLMAKERERADALQAKLAQYERGNQVAVQNAELKGIEEKITTLDAEYAALVTDGQHEKAAQKMREIRALDREYAETKGDLKAAAASARAVERMRYDMVVERLEEAYDVLNPSHADHDEEATEDVLDLAATYRNKGLPPGAALQKAAKKLLGEATAKQRDAANVKPRVSAEALEEEEEGEEKPKISAAEQRRKDAVKRNLDIQKKLPADTSRVGADSDKAGGSISGKDVMRMKFEDFSKLDEETLSRMRGDVIA